jgi:hypothetical protein
MGIKKASRYSGTSIPGKKPSQWKQNPTRDLQQKKRK